MVYGSAMATVISRDNGESWTRIPLTPGENGLNLEGGGTQLRDGTIIALDTYITPSDKPGWGVGQIYTSKDDWHTLQGPQDVSFELPGANFDASSDDGGHPHRAVRRIGEFWRCPTAICCCRFTDVCKAITRRARINPR